MHAPGPDRIIVAGAREHNLRDVDLDIPRDALVVFTGLSGSGKSSLAFDTIYQEGQRRYLESLSSYARQFLGRMDKPDVERITGLSPTLSDRKSTRLNSSHALISYAVFCLKKKTQQQTHRILQKLTT